MDKSYAEEKRERTSITEDGARSLIAAILKQAYEDYTREPDNKETEEAKKFIHSAWCATMCEETGFSHQTYVGKLMDKKLTRDTYRYIESELRNYKQTCKELEGLKRDIIFLVPEQQEGHSSTPGNPTLAKTAKIFTDRRIQRLSQVVNAVQSTYNKCDPSKKQLIELKYWGDRYTDQGISDTLGIEIRTFQRWKKAIVIAIAVELGYL
jgi:RinA family phage transcriptional activator